MEGGITPLDFVMSDCFFFVLWLCYLDNYFRLFYKSYFASLFESLACRPNCSVCRCNRQVEFTPLHFMLFH